MIWLTVRQLRARPLRAFLTGLGVVVGVGLVSGTLVLLDTAGPDGDDPGPFGDVLLIAAAVALLISAFIIHSAFGVLVAQRTRELGLLRCLGADARQLRRTVRLEALLIGVAASLAGLGIGTGLAAGLRAVVNSGIFGDGRLPDGDLVLAPRTVVVAMLCGTLVLVLSALGPARRAGRAAPLAALRGRLGPDGRRPAAARALVGAVLVVAGVGVVLLAATRGPGYLLLPAGALTLIGVRLLGPRIASPLVGVIGLPLARMLGLPGELGRENARRHPDRTAATVSALLIGLALATFVSVLAASTKAYIAAEATRAPDLRVDSRAGDLGDPGVADPAPISATTVTRLRNLPELSHVITLSGTKGSVAGARAEVVAADPAYLRLHRLAITAGDPGRFAAGTIAVSARIAAARGWRVGSKVPVGVTGGTRTLTVAVTYLVHQYTHGPPDYLITPVDYTALGGDPATFEAIARVADGVTPAAARAAIEGAVADQPTVLVTDRAQGRREALNQVNSSSAFYLALTGLAVLVGLFGIATTMSLSIVDQTRELGLLRAIGMDRRQIRQMVRVEAIIVALMGAGLGIGVGLFFGWGAARAFERTSAPTLFTVPIPALAVIAALAIGAGVLAAVLPARAVGRIDVLRAVTAE